MRWLILLIALLVVIFIASTATYLALARSRTPTPGSGPAPNARRDAALKPDQGWEGVKMPNFEGLSQNGVKVDASILDGKVTIVDFIFTHCPLACPMMTAKMQMLSGDLDNAPVRFLSIGIDPSRDTPAVFKAYGERVGADFSRWTFVSGDETKIRGMLRDELKFELQEDKTRPITLEDGSTMLNIIHPTQFFLVGPDRQILAIYSSSNEDDVGKLRDRARAAAGR